MARPPSEPTTRLGAAMRARRGETPGATAAAEIGIDAAVFYRVELGRRGFSGATARALARWLGPPWTTDDVLDAARQPPGEPAQDQDTAAPVVESPPESATTTPAPTTTTPAPPPLPDVLGLRLRLPDGRVLGPWVSFGPCWEREEVEPQYEVSVKATVGPGEAYVVGFRAAGLTGVAARMPLRTLAMHLDAQLLAAGATEIKPPQTETP